MANSINNQFCWNELMTPNISQAKSFYRKVFGWEMKDIPIQDATYTIVKQGDQEIAGMMQTPAGQEHVPPHWMSYIMVDNIESTLSKAIDGGAETIVKITQIPDYGQFAVITDPTGAHVALWQKS